MIVTKPYMRHRVRGWTLPTGVPRLARRAAAHVDGRCPPSTSTPVAHAGRLDAHASSSLRILASPSGPISFWSSPW